jgi:hypothetical protein
MSLLHHRYALIALILMLVVGFLLVFMSIVQTVGGPS